jgi:hypothetical protein
MFGRNLVVIIALAKISPAFALTDETTGFGVDPPAPYVASLTSHPAHDTTIAVDSTTGKPPVAGTSKHLCGVSLKATPANADYSQAELNKGVDISEWREAARNVVRNLGPIDRESVFALNKARGVEYVVYSDKGPDAGNVALFLSIIETPRGRVSLSCATAREGFEAAMTDFKSIRSKITLPK